MVYVCVAAVWCVMCRLWGQLIIFNFSNLDWQTKQAMLEKRIFNEQSTQFFQKSVSLRTLWDTIQWVSNLMSTGGTLPGDTSTTTSALNDDNMIQSTEPTTRHTLAHVLQLLHQFKQLMHDTPPLHDHKQRFGNLAFRDWYNKSAQYLTQYIKNNLTTVTAQQREELIHYCINSFGSQIRMDFGTGHELSFLAFIGAIKSCNLLEGILPRDMQTMWFQYYDLIQNLIKWYNLEPAGSHGVWGLDDHFHLIYIWGASQWLPHAHKDNVHEFVRPNVPIPTPRQLLQTECQDNYRNANFFCNALAFINSVKKGPFHEHSPILYDILIKVSSWSKIRQGLIKMYSVEVFQKFPVVQHFWFGDCFYTWKDLKGNPLPILQEEEASDTPYANNDSTTVWGRDTTRDTIPSLQTVTNSRLTANRQSNPQPRISNSRLRR